MTFAHSSMQQMRALVLSPFCHQPVAVPVITPFHRVMQNVLPCGSERSRRDEVAAILEQLPSLCDATKKEALHARLASRYYRSRYGRGIETQRQQLQRLVNMSDDEVHQWAKNRCVPVRDPLRSH